jgi:hypothetical protein
VQQQKQCTTINHLSLRFRDFITQCNWIFDLPKQSRMAALLRVAFPSLTSIDFLILDNLMRTWLGWTWHFQPHGERWVPFADELSRKSMRAFLENRQQYGWKSEIDFEAAFVGVFYVERLSSHPHNDLIDALSPPKWPRFF